MEPVLLLAGRLYPLRYSEGELTINDTPVSVLVSFGDCAGLCGLCLSSLTLAGRGTDCPLPFGRLTVSSQQAPASIWLCAGVHRGDG